jgi:hypothetical protein
MCEGVRLFTLIESQIFTSVHANGSFFPVTSVSQFIVNYVEPLIFHNEDFPDYAVSRVGSATRLQYNGRFFLFCTEHQMRSYDVTQAAIVNKANGNLVTSHTSVFSQLDTDEDPLVDLRLLEFTEGVDGGALQRSPWFDVSKVMDSSHGNIVRCIAAGFPYLDTSIDYQNRDVPVRPRVIFGSYVGTTIGLLHGMDIDPSLDYDPDGISGGPVFHLIDRDIGFELCFAGLVSNSGRTRLNYIPAQVIHDFIGQA